MKNIINSFLLAVIIFFPVFAFADENIESEIVKEWRTLTSKPQLFPGTKAYKPFRNKIDMTLFLNKVNKNWDKLSPSTQDMLKPALLRPTDPLYQRPGSNNTSINVVYNTTYVDTATAHFKIFYCKDGRHAAADSFVKTVADAFESSYSAGVTGKSFSAPPDDFTDVLEKDKSADKNGGDKKYDVYLLDIGNDFIGTFGWTQPERTPPGKNEYTKYSFIVLDNDYATASTQYSSTAQYDSSQSPENYARVTAAHEFFHAVQFGYNQNVDNWFLEASAVWHEDMVYPDINDYIKQYLKGDYKWFSQPEIPLDFDTSMDIHMYGSGIWPIFLERNFSSTSSIMKDFFNDAGAVSNPNVFNIIDTKLRAKSSSLPSAFAKFTGWNYITGKNYDSAAYYPNKYYLDGALYDTLFIYSTVSAFMTDPATTPSTGKIPGYLGSNYIVYNKSGSSLRIMFNGSESSRSNLLWNAQILIRYGTTYIETAIALNTQNAGGINIDTSFDTVVLIPSIYETAHLRNDLSKFPYTYGFSGDTTAPRPVASVTAFDVPLDNGYFISLQWSASPDDSTDVESYDILRSTSPAAGFTVVNSVSHGVFYNTDNVPQNKTAYYYRIRARDKWLNYETAGEYETSATAIDNIPPKAPANVYAVNTPKSEYGKSIDLSWTRSNDDGGEANDVAGYTIFRSTARSNLASFATAGVTYAGDTTFQDTTGIINESTYYYYVRVEDGHPNYSYSTAYYFYNTASSDTSHDVFIKAKDIWVSAPSEFKAVGINDRIALSWKNPDILDFKKTLIRKKTASYPADTTDGTNISIASNTGTSSSDLNAVIGQTYYFTIFSFDTTGNCSVPDTGSRAQAAITLKAFNYPNPTFSGNTTIRYQLEKTSGVEAVLYIFDIAGELVLKIDNILSNPNNSQPIANVPVYDFNWDGKNGRGRQVASGVYIFMIEANDSLPKKDRTGKIAVIK